MSAYICDNEVFSNIYSGLRVYNSSNQYSEETAMARVKIWREKNIEAVKQRYPYDTMDTLPGPIDKTCIITFNVHISIYQYLKSLECLHYQMSEGNIPDTLEYQEVNNLIESLYKKIVQESNEYEKANW